jgi:hypothetical protein
MGYWLSVAGVFRWLGGAWSVPALSSAVHEAQRVRAGIPFLYGAHTNTLGFILDDLEGLRLFRLGQCLLPIDVAPVLAYGGDDYGGDPLLEYPGRLLATGEDEGI